MRPVVLTILDGWGYSKETNGNAIAKAQTPVLKEIIQNYPSLLLQASGPAVGMTYGESGNSEVGHLTLGAGRIIFQYLTRINKAIQTGDFFNNPALEEAAHHCQTNNSTLHIIGLLTSGAVHAHLNHLLALIQFAKEKNISYQLHLFTDGRDSGLKEAVDLFKKLQNESGLDMLTTVIGRDSAMDRGNHWQLTEATFNLITRGIGEKTDDIFKSLEASYAKNIHDADLPGFITTQAKNVKDGDSIIFFNFREDSMRQLAQSFTEENFDKFERILPQNLYIASMTQYLESPLLHAVFPPPSINNCLSEVLSSKNKKHLHIAETEKYAHVTFFFNALRNAPFEGETDFFVDSVENPIANPEMRAADIASKVASELDRDGYDFYVVNISNGDILAHLGNLEAAIKGVEAADLAVGIIKQKVLEKNGIMIITADHGNVESMIYRGTGDQETKHDNNPVPFHLIGNEFKRERSPEEINKSLEQSAGLLSDVAPTILELLETEAPVEMTGGSLLKQLR